MFSVTHLMFLSVFFTGAVILLALVVKLMVFPFRILFRSVYHSAQPLRVTWTFFAFLAALAALLGGFAEAVLVA